MTDWPMFWITVVYVIATIAICYFNYCSAKATRDQLNEMRRQERENNRPIIAIEVIYINRALLGFRLINEGKRVAYDVSVDLSNEFIQSIQEHQFKKQLISQQGKRCIIGTGNHYDFYFGSNMYFEIENKVPASGFISYTDSAQRKYKEEFSIDLGDYATMYSVESHDEKLEKILKAQNQKLETISKSIMNLSKSITAKTNQEINNSLSD